MILASRVPWPLDKGDKLRMYHQIRMLSESHEIYLVALSDQSINTAAEKELKKYCNKVYIFPLTKAGFIKGLISSIFNGKPLQVGYFFNRNIANRIIQLIEELQPDHIYGQLVRVAEYIKNSSIPKTLDLQDALSAGLQRRAEQSKTAFKYILRFEAKRMRRYEAYSLDNFDFLCIISQADKDLLDPNIQERVKIIPNGVDFEYFKPNDKAKKYDLVFTGNMNYPPNIMAANFLIKHIMPLVWEKLPETKVLLAGSSPHISVQNLANNRVEVSGWMDDIRDAYAEARVFIAPMQIGTGLQNKLLEAMAMGLPCITSDLANKALAAEHNNQILVAERNDKELFAESITKLLNDKNFADKIAKNGNQYVKSNFDWKSTIDTLNSIWEES